MAVIAHVLAIVAVIVLLLIGRTVYLVYMIAFRNKNKFSSKPRKSPAKVLIVVGSGGHTKEIVRLVEPLSPCYNPRIYVVANTDVMSETKIHELESRNNQTEYVIQKIPRSRAVHQSYITSIPTTLYSLLHSVIVVLRHRPDLVICNGPGTCIPICFSAFLLKALFIKHSLIVFIESICRVETLSLSGKLLYFIADAFIVQWPSLNEKFPRSIYLGKLV